MRSGSLDGPPEHNPGGGDLVVSGFGNGLRVLSTEEWGEVRYVGTGDERFPTLLGYSPDEATLLGVVGFDFPGAAGQLVWFDAETYEIARVKDSIHDGHTVAATLSPNRTRIATGSADGFVRVWHSETGGLLHEIPLNGIAVQGVAFVDEDPMNSSNSFEDP